MRIIIVLALLLGILVHDSHAAMVDANKMEQTEKEIKKAQDKVLETALKAEADRKLQIGIAAEASAKASADAAQARVDLAEARADARLEAASIRRSQDHVIYGQYLVTVLTALIGTLSAWIVAKVNKVEKNTNSMIAELVKQAHQAGRAEAIEEYEIRLKAKG